MRIRIPSTAAVMALSVVAGTAGAETVPLSPEARQASARIYFERCAGCHGVLRKGATGKSLEPANAKRLGQARLEKTLNLGTEGGMPNFGDILTVDEIRNLAAYLQLPPDPPPPWTLADMKASWKILVPPGQRPEKPMNVRNLDNIFAVTLRDSGEVAMIDGDTKEIWGIVKTGYAVHISRVSSSGRYVYTIGRDGLLTLIDLWFDKPTTVATLKAAIDARSVNTSQFEGFEDRYAVVGSFWPPQYVVLDGLTLEPFDVVPTQGRGVDGNEHPEARVSAIAASRIRPEWLITIKETGMIRLVDYSRPGNLKETLIPAVRFLHDGGWDASQRYFLAAASNSDKIAVVDAKESRLAALIDTQPRPHAGRGANFVHPRFGPVWATSHLGQDVITLIGTDPDRHPEQAWKVVQELKTHGSASLFVKTHPASANLWVDAPLNPERDIAGKVAVFDLRALERGFEVLDVAGMAGLPETRATQRAVQGEYNQAGDEIWFSIWAGKTDASAIVVIDDRTRKLKAVIKDPRLVTPTGKFNIANTRLNRY